MASALMECLSRYASEDYLRLHMPGHGGVLSAFDVTELPETDDLLCPQAGGAIEADECLAARLFSARVSLFSAGGATLCLQAAIAYQLSRTDPASRVFCARGVHRSVLHALALLDRDPLFFDDPETVAAGKTAQAGDLLIFNGCDYFGNIPDYPALAEACRAKGLHTVIDNAHGTHLRFLDGGRAHPLTYGFELIVDSAHKTLSCLTGAALLHVGADLSGKAEVIRRDLLNKFRLFSTTSPNFLILLSLTEALAEISGSFDGVDYPPFRRTADLIGRVRCMADLPDCGRDPMRLCICGGYDLSGLSRVLAAEKIAVELLSKRELVLLFPASFDAEKAERLGAFLKTNLPLCRGEANGPDALKSAPERVLSLREALFSDSEEVASADAVGRVAAEVVGRYPPGTALCLPGELLEEALLEELDQPKVRVVKEKTV